MIDLHAHPIAGIDDGVRDTDEAVEFCRIAVAEGITTLVATPHIREGMFPNRRAAILEGVESLRERLRQEKVGLNLAPGAEIYLEPDLVARLRAGDYLTLNDGGRYLLLELPTRHLPAGVEEIIYQLRLEGLTPVLAHPERIRPFQEDSGRLARLVELGALSQVTGGSLLGQFGTQALHAARALLKEGLVHVLASDAHNNGARAPRLRQAVEEAASLVGEGAARRLVLDVPQAILAGQDVEASVPAPPQEQPRRGGWLDWLRGLGRA
jgi:protein-tyrosine phosphatase